MYLGPRNYLHPVWQNQFTCIKFTVNLKVVIGLFEIIKGGLHLYHNTEGAKLR